MRVALLSYNARSGDAIGNQVAEKLSFFLDHNAEARVFVQSAKGLHPQIKAHCTTIADPANSDEAREYLQRCDLVTFEYGQYYALLDWLQLLTGEKPKLIVDYHGVTPPELWGGHNAENLKRGVAERGLLWCADGVLVHSWFTYNELVREIHLPAERIIRRAYPIDVPAAAPNRGTNYWRQKLGLHDETVLLYVGRIAQNKNVPLLVEAVGLLGERNPPVHLLVVGDDSDIYQFEADRVWQRARELGVAERVHLLGHQEGDRLWEAYRCADVFVTASAWESFCIPVAEAMAMSVPVVAARATALPDTVGDAGLTFAAGNAEDLARVLRRVIVGQASCLPSAEAGWKPAPRRILVVNGYPDCATVGGVGRSLATIATGLKNAGHIAEFFAASTNMEAGGESFEFLNEAGIACSVFPIKNGSPELLDAVENRAGEIDAIIVGPYFSEITREIALRWPEKTLLLPCWHDEDAARSDHWRQAYDSVAGFLYHTEEERTLAQAELGYNHPNAVVVGTVLTGDGGRQGLRDAGAKREAGGEARVRILIYCGRFSAEKNVPLLLEFAERYCKAHPDRFVFHFVGEGDIPIPQQPWAKNRGVISETEKSSRLLAEADALIHLSQRESLSFAALEAWQAATPVIGHADCAVLAGHIQRSGGGELISGFISFAKTLDDLWTNPQFWADKGRRGGEYVRENYQCPDIFQARLQEAMQGMSLTIHQQMQQKGLQRAAAWTRENWRQSFAEFVEKTLEKESKQEEHRIEVRRRIAEHRVQPGCGNLFVPVTVHNWGATALAAQGPGQILLVASVEHEDTADVAIPPAHTPLPRTLIPGESVSAAIAIDVPDEPGNYLVRVWAELPEEIAENSASSESQTSMRLIVSEDANVAAGFRSCRSSEQDWNPAPTSISGGPCSALLHNVRLDLQDADRLQHLPDDYLDITQGKLAEVKRLIKHKLLNNFKTAYVDVLSHQQSAFNRQMLSAVEELVRCCEMLDHAIGQLRSESGNPKSEIRNPK